MLSIQRLKISFGFLLGWRPSCLYQLSHQTWLSLLIGWGVSELGFLYILVTFVLTMGMTTPFLYCFRHYFSVYS